MLLENRARHLALEELKPRVSSSSFLPVTPPPGCRAPLADIHGKPMVQHVVEKALQSGADRVIVATDDERVQQTLAPFAAAAGFEVYMTTGSPVRHRASGRGVPSLRLCRRHHHRQRAGDEPSFPVIIRQVADNLAAASAPMATLSVPIRDAEEAFNPNAVKVVTDREGMPSISVAPASPGIGTALRPAIACGEREQIGDHYQRHIGIYAYRAGFIQRYVDWAPSVLEQVEALEQLRVLWYGEKIHVAQALQARRWGWTPRPISTRCERCWPVGAGGTALMQNERPRAPF